MISINLVLCVGHVKTDIANALQALTSTGVAGHNNDGAYQMPFHFTLP